MKHKRRLKDIRQRNVYKKTELFQKVLRNLYKFVCGFVLKLLIQIFFFQLFQQTFLKVR